MNANLMFAFAGFAFATSITPGPNNAMLMASGVNFGFRRTLPHIAGVCIGCALMVVLVGFGLGGLFAAYPLLYVVLRWVGAAYLLLLAWHIANASAMPGGTVGRRPMRFLHAVAFQWVNPKAWVMVLGAVTTYAPREDFFRNVLFIAAAFAAISLPSIGVWAGFGVALRRVLDRPVRVRAFNRAMALLLVLSLYPLLVD
jgi:threonine/homoserine/homoserine lactone efflux protein